jgi:glucose-1-phosphate adenylyltransferase
VKFGPGGQASQSLVANGCIILGQVERSVLFPGVFVGPGAVVSGAIIMNATRIEAGARVDQAILDKGIRVGENAVVGHGPNERPNERIPQLLFSGLTVVGKGAVIPAGTRIGRNCCLGAEISDGDFPSLDIPAGTVIGETEL